MRHSLHHTVGSISAAVMVAGRAEALSIVQRRLQESDDDERRDPIDHGQGNRMAKSTALRAPTARLPPAAAAKLAGGILPFNDHSSSG